MTGDTITFVLVLAVIFGFPIYIVYRLVWGITMETIEDSYDEKQERIKKGKPWLANYILETAGLFWFWAITALVIAGLLYLVFFEGCEA